MNDPLALVSLDLASMSNRYEDLINALGFSGHDFFEFDLQTLHERALKRIQALTQDTQNV